MAKLMTPEEKQLATSLSALFHANPFEPQESIISLATYQELTRDHNNQFRMEQVNKKVLVELGTPLIDTLRTRIVEGKVPSKEETQLYKELVFYLSYYHFEEDFDEARDKSEILFYSKFVDLTRFYFAVLPNPSANDIENEVPNWFALFFQIQRSLHYIRNFVRGKSNAIERLRIRIWQSIFTQDIRNYREKLKGKMSEIPTLVLGPAGTSKEKVAQVLALSGYIPFQVTVQSFEFSADNSFFSLNLSAHEPILAESQLCGHRQGAFTGARSDLKGKLATCSQYGAIFLKEISQLAFPLQIKLSQILTTREFQPIGDTKKRKFIGKVISGSNTDLTNDMHSGKFQQELYFLLCSDVITTPTLREQLSDTPDDLQELVTRVIQNLVGNEAAGGIAEQVLDSISVQLGNNYSWPGNFLELEQCVKNILIRKSCVPLTSVMPKETDSVIELETARLTADELLQRYCVVVYEKTGSYVETANRLRLDRRTVKSKIDAWNGT